MSLEDQTKYTNEIGEYFMKKEMKDVLVQRQIENICKLLDGKVEYFLHVEPKSDRKSVV